MAGNVVEIARDDEIFDKSERLEPKIQFKTGELGLHCAPCPENLREEREKS